MGIGQNDDFSFTAGTPHLWLNGIKYEDGSYARGLTVVRLEQSDCTVQVSNYIYNILYYRHIYYLDVKKVISLYMYLQSNMVSITTT